MRKKTYDVPLLAVGDLLKFITLAPATLMGWLDRDVAPYRELRIGANRIARVFSPLEVETVVVMALMHELIGVEGVLAREFADEIVRAIGTRRPEPPAKRKQYLVLSRDRGSTARNSAVPVGVAVAATMPVNLTGVSGAAVIVDLAEIEDRVNRALLAFADVVDAEDVAEVLPEQ